MQTETQSRQKDRAGRKRSKMCREEEAKEKGKVRRRMRAGEEKEESKNTEE